MKTKHLGLFATVVLALAGCYDDSALREQIGNINKDVSNIKTDVEKIKTEISQINTNITALQAVVNSLESKVYVDAVSDFKDTETGEVIGYTILFSNQNTITIYNGEDGEDGATGPEGPQGDPGLDGHSPKIGVALANGVYCWTLDGNFILDAEDKTIPVSGANGQNGATPQIRITDGYWEVSYNGSEWERLGSATGEVTAVDAVFTGVKENSKEVIFYLADGSRLSIPKNLPFGLAFEKTSDLIVAAGTTTSIPYTVNNSSEGTVVDAMASGNWDAEAQMTDYASGVIKVTASEDGKDGKVLVYANNGKGMTDIKTLVFSNGILTVTAQTEEIPTAGGSVTISVSSNIDYTVEVSETWLSMEPATKASEVVTETLTFSATENTSPETRTAEIRILDPQGAAVQTVVISQAGGSWTAPVFNDEKLKTYMMAFFDENEDGVIDQTEAGKAKEVKLTEMVYPISSFEGIGSFYNLTYLKVDTQYNYGAKSTVKSADFSKNTKLEVLDLQLPSLEELNVEGLSNLKELNIASSSVEEIDMPSLVSLEYLYAQNSGLTALDLSQNKELLGLYCYGTKITSLNTSACAKLKEINASSSVLASITLSNPALEKLTINYIPATSVDFSSLKSLLYFSANEARKLENIDLSNSPELTTFYGSYFDLGTLDLSAAGKLATMNVFSCTRVEKIRFSKAVENKVSSFSYPKYYWTDGGESSADVIIEFVEGESVVIDDYSALIGDEFARQAILKAYDADSDGKISEAEAALVTELDLSDYGLTSCNGLENFPLEKLNLSGNKLTEFDASILPAIKWLDLSGNGLSTVDGLTDIENIEHLDLSDNNLSGPYSYSKIAKNNLKYLNFSGNTGVVVDPYNMNALVELNLSKTAVSYLYPSDVAASVEILNLSGTKLTDAVVFSNASSLKSLDISNTGITSIDVKAAATAGKIESINATGTPLSLIIVGPGNSLPEGAVIGNDSYNILNVTNPTKTVKSNEWSYIKEFTAGEKAKTSDFNVNFELPTNGFVVEAGGNASIKVDAGRKVLKFFAIGVNGTPTVQLSRSSGKNIYTNETDHSWNDSYKTKHPNPFTVLKNAAASKDEVNLIIDGDTNFYQFNLGLAGDSSEATQDDETITFNVTGNEGEKVIIFGVNLGSSRDDE